MNYEVVSLLLLGASVVISAVALVFIVRVHKQVQSTTLSVRELQAHQKAVDVSRCTI